VVIKLKGIKQEAVVASFKISSSKYLRRQWKSTRKICQNVRCSDWDSNPELS